LLENGVDLRYIQEILFYNGTTTTETYTDVSIRDIGRIKSPLDSLTINQSKKKGDEERE